MKLGCVQHYNNDHEDLPRSTRPALRSATEPKAQSSIESQMCAPHLSDMIVIISVINIFVIIIVINIFVIIIII